MVVCCLGYGMNTDRLDKQRIRDKEGCALTLGLWMLAGSVLLQSRGGVPDPEMM